MTELNDGISVTGQRISRDSGKSLYFYVDLQDELAELRVKTWGGPGDCELHIALGALPYTDDWGWIEDEWFEESMEVMAAKLRTTNFRPFIQLRQ